MSEGFVHNSKLSIAAVYVIPRELGLVAEVFKAAPAIITVAFCRMQPGDANPISFFERTHIRAQRIHCSDNLMSRNQRQPGQWKIAFYRVQIGVTQTTAAHSYPNLASARYG